MHLPAQGLTPEVDFRLSEQEKQLRLIGDCSPMPAEAFFNRVIGGEENPRVPGLRQIVRTYEGETLELRCVLSRINTDSERGLERLCEEFLTDKFPLRIRWTVPPGEINTMRIGRQLHTQYGDRFIVEGDDGREIPPKRSAN